MGADGSAGGISMVGDSAVSVVGNVATGTGVVGTGNPTDGDVDVSITGPFTTLTLQLNTIPDGGTGDPGGAMVGISDIAFSVVPEPATMGLLSLGGLVMLVKRRRQK